MWGFPTSGGDDALEPGNLPKLWFSHPDHAAGMLRDNHLVNGDQVVRNGDDMVKVAIDLKDEHYGIETLWAEAVGEGRYRLRNVPILAFGYSEQDVVTATEIAGKLRVNGVAEPGGHSTYRLFFTAPTDDEKFNLLWEPLEKLGCTFERANTRVIGIDVPPHADVYAVYAILEQGEQAKNWSFEEGHCGHRLRA